jgi:hypothetical protein
MESSVITISPVARYVDYQQSGMYGTKLFIVPTPLLSIRFWRLRLGASNTTEEEKLVVAH